MISHEKKFIFIEIPRTGTTSILKALRQYKSFHSFVMRHATIHEIREKIGDDKYREYYKFAIHRDDEERLESLERAEKIYNSGQRYEERMYWSEHKFIDETVVLYPFENLEQSFRDICRDINVPLTIQLPRMNYTNAKIQVH